MPCSRNSNPVTIRRTDRARGVQAARSIRASPSKFAAVTRTRIALYAISGKLTKSLSVGPCRSDPRWQLFDRAAEGRGPFPKDAHRHRRCSCFLVSIFGGAEHLRADGSFVCLRRAEMRGVLGCSHTLKVLLSLRSENGTPSYRDVSRSKRQSFVLILGDVPSEKS